MKAKDFDRQFDAGKNVTRHLVKARARRVNQPPRRVNVDFPEWMVTADRKSVV
jgi:hypothetical protein